MNDVRINPINFYRSIFLFGIPAILFYTVLNHIIPIASNKFGIDFVIAWFLIGGFGVFIPLFFLALYLVRKEQGILNRKIIIERLRLAKPGRKEIFDSLIATVWCYLLSALLVLVYNFLSSNSDLSGSLNSSKDLFNLNERSTGAPLILLTWLPFFFFNIFGEEFLWRGFILPGQIVVFGRNAWIVNAIFWLVFHIAFNFELIITLLPILFILPYYVQKSNNTWTGIIIHALYNGPIFILIALGIIS
ncbi:MAG TPA: CPBP family intramembrane metalloprotease [Melioribacteraceae bacterium]|nr:CPBP family intramembrane metalloprotease [Melioribacteraceae bacterium]